jgi:hypothetical protein
MSEVQHERAKNSVVWDCFEKVGEKVVCRECKATLTYGKSTSNMLKHLQAKHTHRLGKREASTLSEW